MDALIYKGVINDVQIATGFNFENMKRRKERLLRSCKLAKEMILNTSIVCKSTLSS